MNSIQESLRTIARREIGAAGTTGFVTEANPATRTLTVDLGADEPLGGVYFQGSSRLPDVGQSVNIRKTGSYWIAESRVPASPIVTAQIIALNASNLTATLDFGGGVIIANIPYLSSYSPSVGNVVLCGQWGSSYVILGRSGSSVVTPPSPTPPSEYPTDFYGDSVCAANVAWEGVYNRTSAAWDWTTSAGTPTVTVGIETPIFESHIQEEYGIMRFDLSGIPSGVSIISAKMILRVGKTVFNDDYSVRTIIRPHGYTSIPSGAPSWDARSITQTLEGTPTVGSSKQYSISLPSSWVTDLLSGSVKGIGFAPQLSTAGFGSIFIQASLEISWKTT